MSETIQQGSALDDLPMGADAKAGPQAASVQTTPDAAVDVTVTDVDAQSGLHAVPEHTVSETIRHDSALDVAAMDIDSQTGLPDASDQIALEETPQDTAIDDSSMDADDQTSVQTLYVRSTTKLIQQDAAVSVAEADVGLQESLHAAPDQPLLEAALEDPGTDVERVDDKTDRSQHSGQSEESDESYEKLGDLLYCVDFEEIRLHRELVDMHVIFSLVLELFSFAF